MVNIKINRLSSNKKIFNENNRFYNEALEKSGFQQRLAYQDQVINNKVIDYCNINNSSNNSSNNDSCNYRLEDSDNNSNSNNKKTNHRKRKVIWFNPTFCKLSNINIGKYFLKLMDRHFNKDNSLNEIFNRNTLKITYSCKNNIFKIIHNHRQNR